MTITPLFVLPCLAAVLLSACGGGTLPPVSVTQTERGDSIDITRLWHDHWPTLLISTLVRVGNGPAELNYVTGMWWVGPSLIQLVVGQDNTIWLKREIVREGKVLWQVFAAILAYSGAVWLPINRVFDHGPSSGAQCFGGRQHGTAVLACHAAGVSRRRVRRKRRSVHGRAGGRRGNPPLGCSARLRQRVESAVAGSGCHGGEWCEDEPT